jgi:hypothetical protein
MRFEKTASKTILNTLLILSLALLAESPAAEEVGGYGDVEWGMSIGEVKKIAPGGNTEKGVMTGRIFYKASQKIGGKEFEATYRFEDGELVSVDLYRSKIGKEDVEAVREEITNRYGPNDSEEMGGEVWYTDKGKLTLVPLKTSGGKASPLVIRYKKPKSDASPDDF